MIKRFTLLFLLAGLTSRAQTSVVDPASDIRQISLLASRTPATNQTVISVGKTFLGKPYVPHTLDVNPTEQLVVNFQQFDCTTFVETTLALTLAINNQPPNTTPAEIDPLFRNYLTKIRYRNGQIDGYASRLHYFSDWLYDNERQGILRDVTGEIGGIQVSKLLYYMTDSPAKYPPLHDPVIFRQVARTEAQISQHRFYFIPKKQIAAIESAIKEGDIIMLTAARPGLDMKHVGFATWQHGRVYLLHASSEYGEVTISRHPLADYVDAHPGLSGIRVARLK